MTAECLTTRDEQTSDGDVVGSVLGDYGLYHVCSDWRSRGGGGREGGREKKRKSEFLHKYIHVHVHVHVYKLIHMCVYALLYLLVVNEIANPDNYIAIRVSQTNLNGFRTTR